jgi:hypothetical protein
VAESIPVFNDLLSLIVSLRIGTNPLLLKLQLMQILPTECSFWKLVQL